MAHSNRALRTASTAAGLILLMSVVPGVADASTDSGTHCSLNARTGEQRCFATVEEAVGATQRAAARSNDDVIQGTLFDNRDYGGDSPTVYGAGLCEKNDQVDYDLNLPGEWQDRISSVQPWGNCWIWLYPEPDLGGERDGPFKENTPFVGDLLDDRTQYVGLS